MTDAQLLMMLFQGSDLAHGRTETSDTVNSKGKRESRSWTEKRPAAEPDFEAHIEGIRGLGMPPLNSKSEVRWGAIDVDIYKDFSLESLNKRIQDEKLPLVLCRSKSGGPHLFLFCKEWVPSTLMLEKLDMLAGYLGLGTSEIFPKQVTVGSGNNSAPDFGNWINLPYFGGIKFFRYALNEKSEAIQTVSEFVAYANSKALSKDELEAVRLQTPILFPDGPPCLNHIFALGVQDFRNVTLCNVAVYLKMAAPDNWKDRLEEINRQLKDPLPAAEVEAIKVSYSKKEYRYQCAKQPLCAHCSSSECKTRKFGIGGKELLPIGRSLSMIRTSPPIWYLDLTMPDGAKKRMCLTTEELQNPRGFQRRCMETLQQMPPLLKAEEWQEVISNLMTHCSIIDVPPEMNPEGQFKDLLDGFLENQSKHGTYEDLLRGFVYKNETTYNFRLRDLMEYVSKAKFTLLKQNEINACLRDMGAQKDFKVIANRGVNFWVLPASSVETPVLTPTRDKSSNSF